MRPRQTRDTWRPLDRPMVVAHRGASYDRAEHTLAAYVAAIDSGADALECDVRLTRDGHLVCVHDRTVQRTSNGRGVVSELDLAGLRALDFASWHDQWPDSADQLLTDDAYLAGVAPDRLEPDGGVLLLDTLLGLVRDSARDVKLLIETKHPTRYGGLVEKELVRALGHFGWSGVTGPVAPRRHRADDSSLVTVMSFAATALRRVRLLAPDVPLVLLVERTLSGRIQLPHGVGTAGPGLHLVRAYPDIVERLHERGRRVYVWTVDEVVDVEYLLGLGVDAIITDRPTQVLAQVSSQ
ncbi:MAG: glycerophosphodiester phosphodiesterase [Actinobacteria bacterium]|nr:glycerophosphodiester phosphodiesterase [Actinomycetota bacterium]